MEIGPISGSAHGQAHAAELNVQVAAKQLDQARLEGRAAVALIEGAGEVAQAPPPPPADGSGRHVNLLA